ncbi:hypothetical protein CPB84DRAFT_559819 [Gymnopilus junonius]|uniref:EH domain-containing protein n=1 Tax=Gymnopilus junonius TaxID=109634 RepID=A0A9P5TH90_GYMJU|nr:hypothetical protein CPB84DRAFT_559819 [Gymnopilus junonius]
MQGRDFLATLHLPYQNTPYDAVNLLLPQQSNSSDYSILISWTLPDEEKAAYYCIFQAWDQFNMGLIQGSFPHQAFETSWLGVDDLNKIWGLVDVHNRGALNGAEFCAAISLILQTQECMAHQSLTNFPRTLSRTFS